MSASRRTRIQTTCNTVSYLLRGAEEWYFWVRLDGNPVAGDHFSVGRASRPWMSEGEPYASKNLLTSYA